MRIASKTCVLLGLFMTALAPRPLDQLSKWYLFYVFDDAGAELPVYVTPFFDLRHGVESRHRLRDAGGAEPAGFPDGCLRLHRRHPVGLAVSYPLAAGRVRARLRVVSGGAIGNVIDRLRYGAVVDFLDFHIGNYHHWPAFNIADSAIFIGVVLLCLDGMFKPKNTDKGFRPMTYTYASLTIICAMQAALSGLRPATRSRIRSASTGAPPDEFRVVAPRPPLSVPPQFKSCARRQPPTTSRRKAESSSQQAEALVTGNKAAANVDTFSLKPTATAAVPATPAASKPAAMGGSSAESAFLQNAGATKADPNVRNELQQHQEQAQETKEDCSWWEIGCSAPDKKEPLVDSQKEKDRIQQDQQAGKPVTEGDTPEVKTEGYGRTRKHFRLLEACSDFAPRFSLALALTIGIQAYADRSGNRKASRSSNGMQVIVILQPPCGPQSQPHDLVPRRRRRRSALANVGPARITTSI